MKDLAEELFIQAFSQTRTSRSEEYKAGAKALLRQRVHSSELSCPYLIGTAQADAWFSGCEEGKLIWVESRRVA